MAEMVDITRRVSDAVSEIEDPLWRFELAALAASKVAGEPTETGSAVANMLAQIAAFLAAQATLQIVLLRHGGSSPRKASDVLGTAPVVAALHAEDTTRTRHLRGALVRYLQRNPDEAVAVLLIGRPSSSLAAATKQLDPKRELVGQTVLRPLSFSAYLKALPRIFGQLTTGIRQTGKFKGEITFRDRLGIAYRMAQGAVHAAWWERAAQPNGHKQANAPQQIMFGHTGNADTSQLEQAMQSSGARTAHLVHGTNIGWPFAGLSNVAVFPSGADARLGASLPAYGTCISLPIDRPAVSRGDGNWALLTSYTHTQNTDFAEEGAAPDIAVVKMVHEAALELGQDPARVFWRPHPQINLVDPREKARLEQAIAKAGFARWPESMAYDQLGSFSAVITTPSTVLSDALRLGQPAIVFSVTPLQSDQLYAAHPLLVGGDAALQSALHQVLNTNRRNVAFDRAWHAIQPGAPYEIENVLTAFESLET